MKLTNYLLPKEINLKEINPLGIILGFTKIFQNNNKLAILLFLGFSTGRVERFLINTTDDSDKLSTSINNDTFVFKGKEYIINLSDSHFVSQEQFDSFSFEQEFMSDGKLSGKFFNNFL